MIEMEKDLVRLRERKTDNMKLIYIMGKSSSGKDTIYSVLKQKMNVNSYVMYTTRPKREDEIDGVSYNFISNEEMQEYIDGKRSSELIEYRTYNTVQGPWSYATISDNQFRSEKDMIMIGTLQSYVKVRDCFQNKMDVELVPIYIEVPDNIRLKRAVEREEKQKRPNFVEVCRRFIADSRDFSEENIERLGINRRFQNLDLNECISEILEYMNINDKNHNMQKSEKNEENER